MAWNPLEVYHSAYLLRCFCFAPNHPSKTTTVLDFADEQSETPDISMVSGCGKCHLYKTSDDEGGILYEKDTGLAVFANSADRYKLRKTGEDTIEQQFGPVLGNEILTLGTGVRILVIKDNSVNLETDIWDTQDELVSCKDSQTEGLDCSKELQVSDELEGRSLSWKSAEIEATATAEAANTGLWNIPDKEAMMKNRRLKMCQKELLSTHKT